jgi:peptidoglycan/LPS O-acetylase OafA/YrhL
MKKVLPHIAHLNGLRAVAFSGVFLYHFRYGCQGGFLGVDIFFVLSGYLMTRSIASEITCGTFSYTSFLRRRFWRLYPALLVTIIASMCLAYGFFSTEHVLQAAKSALASILGVSNVLFMLEDGYFATESTFKPLLHTWSLSVEWQFYLVWPLLMTVGTRLAPSNRALYPLIFLCAASFTHRFILDSSSSRAAFFMLSPRVFEFGLGALASLPYVPRVESLAIGNAMSVMGTILIAMSFQFINCDHGVSAIVALPALTGAIMIIHSPSNLVANRIFTSSLFDYLGKISYSAYLIHWPAYVFYQNLFQQSARSEHIAIAAFFCVFIVSVVMLNAIENECRVARTRSHIVLVMCLLLTVLAICAHCLASDGWKARTHPSAGAVRVYDHGYYVKEYTRMYEPTRKRLPGTNATALYGTLPVSSRKTIQSNDKFDAIAVGDSFCAPFAGLLDRIARSDDKTFLMMSHHSCASFFDKHSIGISKPSTSPRTKLCQAELRPEMLGLIRAARSKIVILSSNWLATSQIWDNSLDNVSRVQNSSSRFYAKSQLEETIDVLYDMGRKVIVVGMIPGSHFNIRACLAAASGPLSEKLCPEVTRFKKPFLKTALNPRRMEQRTMIRDNIRKIFQKPSMTQAQEEGRVYLIDPYEVLCDENTGECLTGRGGEPYYSDDMHLTANATLLFAKHFREAFKSLEK